MREIYTKTEFNAFKEILRKRSGAADSEVANTVGEIIKHIRDKGDSALKHYTQQFDKVSLDKIRIPESTIEQRAQSVEPKIVKALKLSIARIKSFHKKQLEKSWTYSYKGAELGQLIRPLERIGVYVPGGKASYPSTVLMNVIPAQVAGVREIALCVPTPQGQLNPYVMRAIWELGITEVYPIGGAQAVAAMAYGTESIKKVDKITGPGNIFVAEAKKQVFGVVDIDMIAGPSEILIVSDDSGSPEFIAADLLSQAEHDEMASSVLITTSKTMLAAVKNILISKLESLSRKDMAEKSLDNFGALIYAESIEQAFEYSNDIAPEHLEIMVENPDESVNLVKNAGAVFLGNYSTEPLGDYTAGPNHTLPTNGTSRFFSPLGVYDFIKRTSYIKFSEAGFLGIADAVYDLASCEGLHGHADMIAIYNEYKSPVIALQEVPLEEVSMYGVMSGELVSGQLYKINGLVEKPKAEEAPSRLAVIGRYILTPDIFAELDVIPPGRGGEYQLTDALSLLLKKRDIYGYLFKGQRYDAGDKFGFLKATISLSMRRPEFSDKLKNYIKELAAGF